MLSVLFIFIAIATSAINQGCEDTPHAPVQVLRAATSEGASCTGGTGGTGGN